MLQGGWDEILTFGVEKLEIGEVVEEGRDVR